MVERGGICPWIGKFVKMLDPPDRVLFFFHRTTHDRRIDAPLLPYPCRMLLSSLLKDPMYTCGSQTLKILTEFNCIRGPIWDSVLSSLP